MIENEQIIIWADQTQGRIVRYIHVVVAINSNEMIVGTLTLFLCFFFLLLLK